MKKLVIIILLALAGGFFGWIIFVKPSYEYHYYKIPNCKGTYLTAIIYSNIKERGVMFVKGKHNQVPKDNYIIYRNLSGFDAYFKCVVTCINEKITLNHIAHAFDSLNSASTINTKRVYTDYYDSLIVNNKGIALRFY